MQRLAGTLGSMTSAYLLTVILSPAPDPYFKVQHANIVFVQGKPSVVVLQDWCFFPPTGDSTFSMCHFESTFDILPT